MLSIKWIEKNQLLFHFGNSSTERGREGERGGLTLPTGQKQIPKLQQF